MRLVVVLDCAEPERLAAFWSAALGYRAEPLTDPYLALVPPEPGAENIPKLLLQRVPEPKQGKARMHLDLWVERADLDAEVQRLVDLGATVVGGPIDEDGAFWHVLADPEGNELCVLAPSSD